ncbi:NUDIX domain-containing protein [Actinopolymorpha sp. B11F2]|uniref:NUDIX hydrolase n=1 Tax=Actinopolymorpha sp. B11F2 TaxID=3160862 RepID=UPI0032E47D0B
MRKLVQTRHDIPSLPQTEGRMYIADELPPLERCATAFGLTYEGDKLLLTRLRDRDWDITGGVIDPGETPDQAAVREVWEEASAKVEIIELIGYQELEAFFPKPAKYRWPYPISTQVYFRCRLIELSLFEPNAESFDRGLFPPHQVRPLPTMSGFEPIYEEGLRRAQTG